MKLIIYFMTRNGHPARFTRPPSRQGGYVPHGVVGRMSGSVSVVGQRSGSAIVLLRAQRIVGDGSCKAALGMGQCIHKQLVRLLKSMVGASSQPDRARVPCISLPSAAWAHGWRQGLWEGRWIGVWCPRHCRWRCTGATGTEGSDPGRQAVEVHPTVVAGHPGR